jgi:hypothetical protein
MPHENTLQEFLSVADADRAERTLAKLARHNLCDWGLTGGIAIDFHLLRLGRRPPIRVLNDLDFVARSFDCIPESLARDFLFRHVHASDSPGKMILQLVDMDCALRIDVFQANGATMDRTRCLDLPSGRIQLASIEDLAARAARLALDISEGIPTSAKHANDFLRLAELVHPPQVEKAWQDHRKPHHPATFAEASGSLKKLIPAHPELLIAPPYSRDTKQSCPRCASTSAFSLADPETIMASLGYC